MNPSAPALDVRKNGRSKGVAEADCGRVEVVRLIVHRKCRESWKRMGPVEVTPIKLPLQPNHPSRPELIVAADLPATDNTAVTFAAISGRSCRNRASPDRYCVHAVLILRCPSAADVAADIAAAPAPHWRRRRFEGHHIGCHRRRGHKSGSRRKSKKRMFHWCAPVSQICNEWPGLIRPDW